MKGSTLLTYLYRAFLKRFEALPAELQIMILCLVAAQGVGQLQAIGRSNETFNSTILAHQHDIVRSLLNSLPYRTADRIYSNLNRPVNPDLNYLFLVTRRCEIVKELAIVFAGKLREGQSWLSYRLRDDDSFDRFVQNVEPYLLTLGNLFECYRDALASFEPNGKIEEREIGHSILSSRYDAKTMYRICALYYTLNDIVDVLLRWPPGPRSAMSMILITKLSHTDCTDILTFGGLEAVKDIIVEPGPARYHEVLCHHFARTCPEDINRAPPLPQSTLPPIDRATADNIRGLLPTPRGRILNIYRFVDLEAPREQYGIEEELKPFYEHMLTYEGEEPDLVIEG